MQPKFLVLLAMAFAFGMVVTIAFINASKERAEPTTIVEVYVAKENIEAGAKLTSTQFTRASWPQSQLPEGAIFELEKFDQRYLKQNLYAGEPLLEAKVSSAHMPWGCLGPLSQAELDRIVEDLTNERHDSSASSAQ